MNAFSPEKRESIEACMVEEGFSMLKEGGLRNIRIDEIARKCGIAKGSFYSFFDTKAAFIYRIMVAKREEAKRKLQDHLQDGKLSFDGLYQYFALAGAKRSGYLCASFRKGTAGVETAMAGSLV